MNIGASEITDVIVASTTSYISEYSPEFLLIGGMVLAFGVIGGLIDVFFSRNMEVGAGISTPRSYNDEYSNYSDISKSVRVYSEPTAEQYALNSEMMSLSGSERRDFFLKNYDKLYDFTDEKSEKNIVDDNRQAMTRDQYAMWRRMNE